MNDAHARTKAVDGAPSAPAVERLAELVLGLGATYGYSRGDLTNLREAVSRREVRYEPSREGADREPRPRIELRIHGVGGAPPEVNLESPSTLQVAGDGRAGFYRAWYPGGTASRQPLREAYCWGQLDTSWWTAFWLLLLPFGLFNVAYWALPADDGPQRKLKRQYAARALLRLQSLVLTGMLVATTCYLMLDMVAWQAAQRNLLPGWLDWYDAWSLGGRMAAASVVVFLVVALLWWLSHRTQGAYEEHPSGGREPDASEKPMALSDPRFWCGARTVARQRQAHLFACAAVFLMIESLPDVESVTWFRHVLFWLSLILGVAAIGMCILPWTDRPSVPHDRRADGTLYRTGPEWVVWVAKWLVLGFCVAIGLGRVWWEPQYDLAAALPYDSRIQLYFFWAAIGSVVAFAAVVMSMRPDRQKAHLFAAGYASVGIALLATMVSTIFTASLLKTATRVLLLARPTMQTVPVPNVAVAEGIDAPGIYLPSTAYAGGLAFGVTVALAALIGLVLVGVRWRWAKEIGRPAQSGGDPVTDDPPAGLLWRQYSKRGYVADSKAVKTVSKTIASSRLTDLAGVSMMCLAVPTALAYVVYEWSLWRNGISLGHVASAGAYLATAATGAFIGYVRSAVTDASARKRVGLVWDVITFWPRGCHPLGPPSYAERSVPEVATRIRRIVGDVVSGDDDPARAQQQAECAKYPPQAPRYAERHLDVLLVGYSQGCPIATAVVAQLPDDVRRRVNLLTLASPVRRLYGRAFPAYFGHDQIQTFSTGFGERDRVRWRNLVRESDYVGGWVLTQADGDVDRWILDPPVLWEDTDPSPPPMHLHSNWFSDPQTRSCADELLAMPVPPGGDEQTPA